jgi:pimeloyl-ACP methyl ester carboxylesterase
MRKIIKFLSGLLLVAITFSACRKEPPTPVQPGSKNFVSATSLGVFPKTTLQALAVKTGFGDFAPLANYDVEFFKLIYKTTFKGKDIQVSGLVGVPKNTPVAPSILSAQHGTIFKFTDAPSNFPNTFTGFELFGSAGFVTLIPDFIGYGVSQNTTHPYYDQQSSGLTVVDMISATKFFLQQQSVAISNRLFLLGYSEGGYVTMAAQKEIETVTSHNLALTAAAEGAGGYDLNVMLSGIATASTYAAPSFLGLLTKSYDSTYNWNRPYSDFFQQPYATRLPALLDGSNDRTTIDAALTTTMTNLFNPVFFTGLLDPTKETAFKQQLINNSFNSWVPKSPTQLYHGTADEAVFFQTSAVTYARFQAAGATNVAFFPIPGGTHETSVKPMMLNTLPWLLSLDK